MFFFETTSRRRTRAKLLPHSIWKLRSQSPNEFYGVNLRLYQNYKEQIFIGAFLSHVTVQVLYDLHDEV